MKLSPDFKASLYTIALMIYLALAILGFEEAKTQSPVIIEVPTPRQTLPQKCAKYYNDGTENWINCMGVGYVPKLSMMRTDI